MLRFFSSIRKNLLAENKTVRYLKYAVGEVLLVVIGILIALSVNNWNEDQKLEKQRLELIENLKVDCETNLERLKESIAIADTILSALDNLLKVSAGEQTAKSVDELRTYMNQSIMPIPFQPSMSAFQAAKSTGLIHHLKDRSLHELYLLFEFHYQSFQDHVNVLMHDTFLGSTKDLRNELGSLYAFYGNPSFKPKVYSMNDEEYTKFIEQKQTYSWMENVHHIEWRKNRHLQSLKDITQQILTALEDLD